MSSPSPVAEARRLHCARCRAWRDSDFCPICNDYLAWDPAETASLETVSPDASATEQATTETMPTAACLHLQVRVGDDDAEDPVALRTLRLAAGSTLALTAMVRNETGLVDELDVEVRGLPPQWVTVDPERLHLAPVGAGEVVAGQATVTIRPPRVSSTEPRMRPFAITVRSANAGVGLARVKAALTVEPFAALELSASPPVAVGRREARFACELGNLGNSESAVTLLASDAAQACWFDLPPQVSVPAGTTSAQTVGVRPVRALWIGRPTEHRVQIRASALAAGVPSQAASAAGVSAQAPPLIYRQRPWIPWWVPPLVLFLLVLAAALYLALPREVTVPALIGAPSAFAAQQQLSRAGLHGPPQVTAKVLSQVAPGTVVGQAPPAGASVAPTTPVTLQVAAAPSVSTIVPDLAGMTPARAEAALARVHLKLGAVSPALNPKAHVASQLPTPGSLRPQEAAVQVVLAPQKTKVPNLRGRTLRAAERLLTRAGLALGSVTPPPRPGAKVLTQLPSAGTRAVGGSKVEVVVVQRAVVVPRLRGMTVQAADVALGICSLSLAPLPPNARAGQLVAAQVPGPGAHAEAGSAVRLMLQARPTRGASTAPALPTPRQCVAL